MMHLTFQLLFKAAPCTVFSFSQDL